MDFYKKKPLKYSHESVRRDIRHAETLKARESSRFKRLSIIRDMMDQSDYKEESIEAAKPVEVDQKVEQVPASRLELMRKWKQEKALKKQLEAKSKVKPFYAGKKTIATGVQNQNNPIVKFSSNISFNASKISACRLENSVPKPISRMNNKASSIPSFPKKNTIAPDNSSSSTTNQYSAGKSGVIGSRLPGIKSNFAGTVKSSKAVISSQKPTQESALPKSVFSKLPSKSLQKEIPKLAFSKLPSKPIQKVSAPSVIQKSVAYGKVQPKTTSGTQRFAAPGKVQPKTPTAGVFQKSTTGKIQTKTPTPSVFQKSTPSGKMQPKTPTPSIFQKSTPSGKMQPKESEVQARSIPARKGFCFKKAVADARKEVAENKKIKNTASLKQESNEKLKTKPLREESIISQKLENVPDFTLNCDVSAIKPKQSFAPDDFKFQPPSSLTDFMFEDDDDPYAVLEEFKMKYMSRTSTPSKKQVSNPEESVSSSKNTPLVDSNSSKKDLSDPSLKELQTANQDDPAVSITRDLLENLSSMSWTMSSKVVNDQNAIVKLDETSLDNLIVNNDDSKKNASGIEKFDCCDNDKNTSDDDMKDESKKNANGIEKFGESGNNINTSADDMKEDSKKNTSGIEKLVDCGNIQNTSDDDMKEDSKKNTSGIKNFVDCDNIQIISDEHSKYSEKLCDQIVKASNGKDSNKNEAEEHSTKTANDGDEFIKETNESLEGCDSPFDIVDLSKINDWDEEALDSIKFDEKRLSERVELPEDKGIPKGIRKSSRISFKRVSMLSSITKLNAIDENLEDEDSNEMENSVFTPRRSVRLLHKRLDSIKDLPSECAEENLISISPFTPRRSLRLQNAAITNACKKDESIFSPFKVRTPKQGNGTRRSMRLIDLNTPEKDIVQPKSNLTADFEKLNLNETENRDPNALLIGVENSPSASSEFKSRKVSLLYSPIKGRKSIRKSIKGDLMSFSPAE